MKIYDYRKEIEKDIKKYIEDYYSDYKTEYKTLEEFKNDLEADIWYVDSVTGRASGSYFKNKEKAEKALIGNYELLAKALEALEEDFYVFDGKAETADMLIRSYVYPFVLEELIEQYKFDFKDSNA